MTSKELFGDHRQLEARSMKQSTEQRAEAQQWASKIQVLERTIQEIEDTINSYLDGLITNDEAMRKLVFIVKASKA